MPNIWVGPTGRAIHGHVLDCARAPLERKIREYDECLYLKWNPRKLSGWGCWELRRRPETKSVKEHVFFKGNTYTVLEYKETDHFHHVFDVPFLNYSLLEKIKRSDMWQASYRGKDWINNYEYMEAKWQERVDEKSQQAIREQAKEYKREIRDFRELILSGFNPAQIADFWGKK